MDYLVFSIIGLVVGIVATILVSSYFFSRSIDKKLSPYIQLALPVLRHVHPDVRARLRIQYQDRNIDDLLQARIIIVNEGQLSIRDCIQPLTLPLPPEVSVLDASILYIHPGGRDVALEMVQRDDGGTDLRFLFSLLNRNEFFVVQILLDRVINLYSQDFTIAVDDLPPNLPAQKLPYSAVRKQPEGIQWEVLGIGVGLLLVPLSSFYGMVLLRQARPELFPFPLDQFSGPLSTSIPIAIWFLGTLLLLALSLLLAWNGLFEGIPRRRPRFTLPTDLRHFNRYSRVELPMEIIMQDLNDEKSMSPNNSLEQA